MVRAKHGGGGVDRRQVGKNSSTIIVIIIILVITGCVDRVEVYATTTIIKHNNNNNNILAHVACFPPNLYLRARARAHRRNGSCRVAGALLNGLGGDILRARPRVISATRQGHTARPISVFWSRAVQNPFCMSFFSPVFPFRRPLATLFFPLNVVVVILFEFGFLRGARATNTFPANFLSPRKTFLSRMYVYISHNNNNIIITIHHRHHHHHHHHRLRPWLSLRSPYKSFGFFFSKTSSRAPRGRVITSVRAF